MLLFSILFQIIIYSNYFTNTSALSNQTLRYLIPPFMSPYSFLKCNFILLLCITLSLNNEIESRCHNLLEKNGKCSKCPPSKFLYKGDCYHKIRGCQDYLSDKVCLSCQPGYVLNEGSCIKEAIFYRLDKTEIPPMRINIEGELSLNDIEQRIGDSRKGMFEMMNRYFKEKYARQLSSCTINNVKYIETINGVIFTIYYRSMMKIYEAVGFIDSKRDSKRKKTITELEFNQKTSIPTYSLEEINSGLKKKYQTMLKDCTLSTIHKLADNRYTINYVNSKGQKFECLFAKEPFQEINDLHKIDNPIDMEDIFAYIFNLYPDLKSLDYEVIEAPFFDSNSNEGTYIFIFGQKIEIKLSFLKGVFDLLSYKNLELEKVEAQPQTSQAKITTNSVGGFSAFEDLTDPAFVEVWKQLITQFPKYEKYQITSVEYQVMTGTNYILRIRSPKEILPIQHVKALVFYPLTGPIEVLSLEVEGQTVDLNTKDYKEATDKVGALQKTNVPVSYDYKKDPQFAESYKFLLNDLKIVNTAPITQVNKLQSQENILYEIVYSEKQKAKVKKHKKNQKNLRKDQKKYEVVYYMVDGTDLVSGIKTDSPNKNFMKEFIKSQKPQIFKNIILKNFKSTSKGYESDVLSFSGIYKAQVNAQNMNLQLYSLIMLSQSNCYEFSESQYPNSTDVTEVDEFLKNNYGMGGSVMELFQMQIKENSKRYRVIYTDKSNKRLEIILDNFSGKFIVVQSFVLEDEYKSIAPGDQRILGVQAISRLRFGQFIKNCEIKLRLTNQTHFKLFYSCPSKAFEYVFNPAKKADKLQIIYQEPSTNSQSQQKKKTIVDLKQAVKDQAFIEIDNTIRKRFVEYVQTNQVTEVQRESMTDNQGKSYTFYKLYYSSTLGHYVCEITWTNGQVRILNFYLETKQTNKNCQVLDEKEGVCIKCLQNHWLEFGKCYEKIESCLTQVGHVCVQCDKRTLLRSGKCLRDCDEAFKLRQAKKVDE